MTAKCKARPRWVRTVVRMLRQSIPKPERQNKLEAAAIRRERRNRLALAIRRVRKRWPDLSDRVFDPLAEAIDHEYFSRMSRGGDWRHVAMSHELCLLVLESVLRWVLCSDPVGDRRKAALRMHQADLAVLKAGRSLVEALAKYDEAAANVHLDRTERARRDELVEATAHVADRFPEWGELVGFYDGPLEQVLQITRDTSQRTPGIGAFVEALIAAEGVPKPPSHPGSRADAEEPLARLFFESLDRIGRNAGCAESGPLAWLSDERLTLLMNTVRGSRHPDKETVKRARAFVIASRKRQAQE